MHEMSGGYKQAITRELDVLVERKTDLYDFVVENFPVFTSRRMMSRFLLHYEIFKRIEDLPGSIVDLGVFRGASVFTWAKLCEIFVPTDVLRKVYAFDTFSGFPAIREEDGGGDAGIDRVAGGYAGGDLVEEMLHAAQAALGHDKFIRGIDRIEFFKGSVTETIPKFLADKGHGLKICLLNLDLDLYEPTLESLRCLVPRMVRGGIILIDEYAHLAFGGETKAVDEYFQELLGRRVEIRKFPFHANPSGYIVVDW